MRATASSYENESLSPAMVLDGNFQTRWSSHFSDPQWLKIDLGTAREIVGIVLYWETAYGKSYDILISQDGTNWTGVYGTEEGDGSVDDIYFGKKKCRYIKILGKERGTPWGYSLWEVAVKGLDEELIISASSTMEKNIPDNIFDGDTNTIWHSAVTGGAEWIKFASKKNIECGRIELTWGKHFPVSYAIQTSSDGNSWETIYEQKKGKGGTENIPVSIIGARYMRIVFNKSNSNKGYSIAELKFKSWKEIAAKSGLDMARSIVGWEGYEWVTFVGRDGTFAPEPYPYQVSFWVSDNNENQLYTPETLPTSWKLKQGKLPISIVSWEQNNIKVTTTIFARKINTLNRMITFARTTVKNNKDKERNLSLYVLVRQNPLAAKWNTRLNNIQYDGNNLIRVNGKSALFLKEKPAPAGATVSSVHRLAKVKLLGPNRGLAVDGANIRGGMIAYRMNLKPGEEKAYDFMSLSGEPGAPSMRLMQSLDFSSNLTETENYWKKRINFKLELPDQEYANCFYSSIYYILLLMKGNALLYPGPYAYKTFFLHDAVEMTGALDKAGLHTIARRATNHFNTGQVGGYMDELGGSIFGLYEHYRITQDKAFLRMVYPRMVTGCRLIKKLRSGQMGLGGTPYYGLMPKSVSQDNFTIPAYLYVDNWWSIIGLKATVEAAKVLNITSDRWINSEYESLLRCTLDSIRKVMQKEKIDYMTGFADYWPPAQRKVDAEHRILGDTQMAWAHRPALFPGQSLGIQIPMDLFAKSYKHYWEKSGRFSNYDGGWYVEYEQLFWGYNVQLAHPLIFLGMEDVALKNLKWSLEHQSCPGGWSEAMNTRVNKQGYREISEGIIGDVPHGWVAAYYVLLLRNMLLMEDGKKLVLLPCVPASWLKNGRHIGVGKAPTYFGEIDFRLESHIEENYLKLTIDARKPPPAGYVLKLPLKKNIKSVKIDSKDWENFEERKVQIPSRAKEVVIFY